MSVDVKSGSNPERLEAQVLKACGMLVRPVEPHHQLIDTSLSGITEFYSDADMMRYVAVPVISDTARMHVALLERRLPVFSAISRDQLLLMLIPEGTKPLRSMLPGLERDPNSYGALFVSVGQLCRRLEESGLGTLALPTQDSLLNRIAFAAPEQGAGSGSMYLVPPYEFDLNGSVDEEIARISAELEYTERFSEEQIDYFKRAMQYGYTALG